MNSTSGPDPPSGSEGLSAVERSRNRALALQWEKTGNELAARHREELSRLEFPSIARIVNDLIAAGLAHAQPRDTSGLVEQQRLFAIIRQRLRR